LSSCPPCQPRQLPAPLNDFYSKLGDLPAATLTDDERQWVRVFKRVQEKFPQLSTEDSFAHSLFALLKSHEKGFGRNPEYVYRACVYEHVEALNCRKSRAKVFRPRPRPLGSKHASRHRWAAEDVRIDLNEAIDRLGADQGLAVRMKRDHYTYADIANALGVSERQAHRVVKDAYREVRERLGEDYMQAA
jgi:hypothetical protein